MRTPNTECILCKKLLYRRPREFENVRYFACMGCRSEAQAKIGITTKQAKALALGKLLSKGPIGHVKSEETKDKISKANINFWKRHPKKAKSRGLKIRGSNHYSWKGGNLNINKRIRGMEEFKTWKAEVVSRDKQCIKCTSKKELEAHHKEHLSSIIKIHNIITLNDARKCEKLWNIQNDITLCRSCHFKEHGRDFKMKISEEIYNKMPEHLKSLLVQLPNPEKKVVLDCFPVTKSGAMKHKVEGYKSDKVIGFIEGNSGPHNQHGDSGSAGRFFYCAKVSTSEREAGLEAWAKTQSSFWQTGNGASGKPSSIEKNRKARAPRANDHPTVKPVDLMRYLISIYCPHNGVVLDPFLGSGTTGIACIKAGKQFIGIEKDKHYCEIATNRINHHYLYR